MDETSKIHVGLDVHKDSISIACARPGREPGRLVSRIAHDVPKLLKHLIKLGAPEQLHLVYEAGPTGFGLARKLLAMGYSCEVIAPSKTPRRPGDRVKTDARDSIMLAEYSRSGTLHPVWIPDQGFGGSDHAAALRRRGCRVASAARRGDGARDRVGRRDR